MRLRKRAFAYIEANPEILSLPLHIYSRTLGANKWHVARNNCFEFEASQIQRTTIEVAGSNNEIRIGHLSRLTGCLIHVAGSSNRITIGARTSLKNAELWIEDDYNEITIGDRTTIAGKTHLAAIEGTRIDIGRDCMFSRDIRFSTGDSHSIINAAGERINPSRDIRIGDHVWIGNRALCLKGTRISDNSVIGAGSIVTSRFEQGNVIILGSPARAVKNETNWLRERI